MRDVEAPPWLLVYTEQPCSHWLIEFHQWADVSAALPQPWWTPLYQITLNPDSCTHHDAHHTVLSSSGQMHFLYLLSFKNFPENFQRFETGLLSSVTVVISSACWVIQALGISRCIPSRSKQTCSLLWQITQFKKMIMYSLSFSSHYLFLHLFPL